MSWNPLTDSEKFSELQASAPSFQHTLLLTQTSRPFLTTDAFASRPRDNSLQLLELWVAQQATRRQDCAFRDPAPASKAFHSFYSRLRREGMDESQQGKRKRVVTVREREEALEDSLIHLR